MPYNILPYVCFFYNSKTSKTHVQLKLPMFYDPFWTHKPPGKNYTELSVSELYSLEPQLLELLGVLWASAHLMLSIVLFSCHSTFSSLIVHNSNVCAAFTDCQLKLYALSKISSTYSTMACNFSIHHYRTCDSLTVV